MAVNRDGMEWHGDAGQRQCMEKKSWDMELRKRSIAAVREAKARHGIALRGRAMAIR